MYVQIKEWKLQKIKNSGYADVMVSDILNNFLIDHVNDYFLMFWVL